MAGLDNRTKKSKMFLLNWEKKGNHIYYSINYEIYKKKCLKRYDKFKKSFEKKYNMELKVPKEFDYLIKKVRKF